ncbi:hypothetical protein M2651_10555 [Clostridium sp. SYSU_GA19001]|uniref:hypothetical protein n=1 Tax=Clostridium caldaquaticum TaxID=2940653 RepID=UPI0020779A4C|nr:hypothetical protein [Clostridium caldaquaticum]MCM8711461.1 hypothetical protein [Clostridium caldaquaticum]
MSNRSHICLNKLDKVPAGKPFEYKDIVQDDFALENHTEDGKRFKAEVEQGMYSNVKIEKDTGSHLLYRKL